MKEEIRNHFTKHSRSKSVHLMQERTMQFPNLGYTLRESGEFLKNPPKTSEMGAAGNGVWV